MKRIYFILCTLCVCMIASAQKTKVETFDKNSWKWIEGGDKYQSVTIEDGFMLVSNLQNNKKETDYQNQAKTFVKLPLRPEENFKLNIKYLVPDYNEAKYHILFNTDKKCMMDEEEEGGFQSYILSMEGQKWNLRLGGAGEFSDELPGKVKIKGEYPMELVIEKRSRNVTIELNGIQLYEGQTEIKTPYMGFLVPLFDKKKSYIKVDEIVVEQAEQED